MENVVEFRFESCDVEIFDKMHLLSVVDIY